MSKEDKAERLAAQLRENLRRRKAQARAVDAQQVVPALTETADRDDDPS